MSLFNLNPFSVTRTKKSEPTFQNGFSVEEPDTSSNISTELIYDADQSMALREEVVTPEKPEFVKHFTALKRSDFY
ncbi:hypothetical protein [Vibrio aquimaris]|uniref:Uncharacterized protein n=1 Tax=Vibrio aquimaris TaxID=2587862 RepID=A0A5P9CLD1_9VIBR|nr:hypothetical protein [Vibrio aquimaris]QFT26793.1 hypothetical protein FIV01_10165 [Vibrio aquimaris]